MVFKIAPVSSLLRFERDVKPSMLDQQRCKLICKLPDVEMFLKMKSQSLEAWGGCSAECGHAVSSRQRSVLKLPNSCGKLPVPPALFFALFFLKTNGNEEIAGSGQWVSSEKMSKWCFRESPKQKKFWAKMIAIKLANIWRFVKPSCPGGAEARVQAL